MNKKKPKKKMKKTNQTNWATATKDTKIVAEKYSCENFSDLLEWIE